MTSAPPDLRGSSSINLREHGVKASEAAESCENSYFHHRLIGFIDEPFRALNAWPSVLFRADLPSGGGRTWAGRLTGASTEARGKCFDRRSLVVESALLDNGHAARSAISVARLPTAGCGKASSHKRGHSRYGRNPDASASAARRKN